MTSSQIKRLIHLHGRVERHLSEYLRFSTDLSTQSKALWHLKETTRVYSQILGLIRDSTSVSVYAGQEKFPVETSSRL